jgi:hypothetical protein
MKNWRNFRLTDLLFPVLLLNSLATEAQQRPDTAFSLPLQTTTYDYGRGPEVAIDAAHHNFHTLKGGFAPFGRLLATDGYRVQSMHQPLTTLIAGAGPRILVIANALDASDTADWILPDPSAFSKDEILRLHQWVQEGGRVLLIADHMPFAGAAGELAAAFGFRYLNGFAFTGNRTWPPSRFTRLEGTLLSSPVTDAGATSTAINEVTTFTGSAFTIPDQAIPVVKFKPEHWSLQPDTAWVFHPGTPRVQLGGYCQGALLKYGKGRIAVFGEAAMFTAQVVNETRKVGFNSPEAPQNAMFLLNVIHWLDSED